MCSTLLKLSEALEVIGKVGHADLDADAGNADGTHDLAHAMLLPAKTCSTAERMAVRFTLARAWRGGVAYVGECEL